MTSAQFEERLRGLPAECLWCTAGTTMAGVMCGQCHGTGNDQRRAQRELTALHEEMRNGQSE